eukprot:2933726-Amphidinium_carterae.1
MAESAAHTSRCESPSTMSQDRAALLHGSQDAGQLDLRFSHGRAKFAHLQTFEPGLPCGRLCSWPPCRFRINVRCVLAWHQEHSNK